MGTATGPTARGRRRCGDHPLHRPGAADTTDRAVVCGRGRPVHGGREREEAGAGMAVVLVLLATIANAMALVLQRKAAQDSARSRGVSAGTLRDMVQRPAW